jgi:hypothetical protein
LRLILRFRIFSCGFARSPAVIENALYQVKANVITSLS